MDESAHLRPLALQRFASFGFGENLAPGLFDADNLRPVAPAHLGDTFGKKSGGENKQLLTRIDKVGYRRLHAGAARAGDSESEVVLGAEDLLQASADLCVHL